MATIEDELAEERPFVEKLVRLMDLTFHLGKESVACERYKNYLSVTAPQQAEKNVLFHELVTAFTSRKPIVNTEYLLAIKEMLKEAFPTATERDLLKYSVDIYVNEIRRTD